MTGVIRHWIGALLMIFLEQAGVGTTTLAEREVYDSTGTGMLPVQAAVTGTVSFKVNGRVAPDAPWVEIIAAGSASFLNSISWVPYLQLEVVSGAGSVKLWVGEK